eukprot:scaffold7488_cov444-Prasinococcus_capsulatus_cf.AAC.1
MAAAINRVASGGFVTRHSCPSVHTTPTPHEPPKEGDDAAVANIANGRTPRGSANARRSGARASEGTAEQLLKATIVYVVPSPASVRTKIVSRSAPTQAPQTRTQESPPKGQVLSTACKMQAAP